MPFSEASLEGVERGLTEIEAILRELCKSKNASVDWDVKYSMITRGGRTIKNEDGNFTFMMELSDPRNTLVVSDESFLPTRDWKMKLEWIKRS